MKKQKVLIVLGPTASGKSGLGIKLAKKFNGEIISADSRQVYKGLDIGSGKVTKKEMGGIPHHMLDVANPKERFSASDYKKLASLCIQYTVGTNKLPIVVGGTGFYIDTLTGAVNLPKVPPNPMLRKKLEKMSVEKLFKILDKKDPARAKNIDKNNKVRLVRALEIVDALGKVPTWTSDVQVDYDFIFVGINPDRKILDKKIYIRIIERLPKMIQEAKKLHKEGLSYKRMEELGLEYRYLARLLQGKLNKSDMVNKLYKEIRDYSKRQMTWFKRNKKIKWFSSAEFAPIHKYLEQLIKE